ncbi:hypothetical protein CFIMG_003757RA [Ceratocystis fimbriata CBS 114723]|uniref:Uncharacterized protein n=1 Tax=Ceratocystis fimbriata CBS 114723 TaxID=1035309 RepID=A0A2C5X2P0_9PEZI|nr:hypothetical protein CFIMG_003757RA [Ceratocystis fimbriata CBS 114723]
MELSPLDQISNVLSTELDARSLSVPATIIPSGLLSPNSAQVLYAFIHYSYTQKYVVPLPIPSSRRSLMAHMQTSIDVLAAATAAGNTGLADAAEAEFASLRPRLKDRDVLDVLSIKRGAHPTVDAELRALVENYHSSPARAETLQTWVTLANAPSLCAAISGAYLASRSELSAAVAREAAAMRQAVQIRSDLDEERRVSVRMSLQLAEMEARVQELEREREEERMKLMVEDMHRASQEHTQVERQMHEDGPISLCGTIGPDIGPGDVDLEGESEDDMETTDAVEAGKGRQEGEMHIVAGIHEMDGESAVATAAASVDGRDCRAQPATAADITPTTIAETATETATNPDALAPRKDSEPALANDPLAFTAETPPDPQHAFQDLALEPAATDESDFEVVSIHPPSRPVEAPLAEPQPSSAAVEAQEEEASSRLEVDDTGKDKAKTGAKAEAQAEMRPDASTTQSTADNIADASADEPSENASAGFSTALHPTEPSTAAELERPALPPRPQPITKTSIATAAVTAAVTAVAAASPPLLSTTPPCLNFFHHEPEQPTTALSPITVAADSSPATGPDAIPAPILVSMPVSGGPGSASCRPVSIPGGLPASPTGSLQLNADDADGAPVVRDYACQQTQQQLQHNLPPSPCPSPSISSSPSTRRARKTRFFGMWPPGGNSSTTPTEGENTVLSQPQRTKSLMHVQMPAQAYTHVSETPRGPGWSSYA